MKRKVIMPNEEIKPSGSFTIVPVGEHRFQITDIIESDNPDYVSAKCEVISDKGQGTTLLHRLTLNPDDKFFWLTRIFLKAIGEPHKGEVEIDTDAWVARQITGRVEHTKGKNGNDYANIREIIIKEGDTYIPPVGENKTVTEPSEIQWDG